MVSSRRSGIYPDRLGYGTGDDPRPRFSLLGPLEAEVCFEHDLGVHGLFLRHYFSMVLLGLLLGLFEYRCQWLYWRLDPFWTDGHFGLPQSWLAPRP